jgi:hypothetical protein
MMATAIRGRHETLSIRKMLNAQSHSSNTANDE